MIGYFSVITWGITCLNCISFEWQLVNLHLIRDNEICEQSCREGGLVNCGTTHTNKFKALIMRCLYFTSCMTCMSCTTDRTPSPLYLSNEMLPSTCCKYFTFCHSSISHSPLQPTAQLNNLYHLSLRFYNLNKWWVLDIPCCGLIYIYLHWSWDSQ